MTEGPKAPTRRPSGAARRLDRSPTQHDEHSRSGARHPARRASLANARSDECRRDGHAVSPQRVGARKMNDAPSARRIRNDDRTRAAARTLRLASPPHVRVAVDDDPPQSPPRDRHAVMQPLAATEHVALERGALLLERACAPERTMRAPLPTSACVTLREIDDGRLARSVERPRQSVGRQTGSSEAPSWRLIHARGD